MVGEIMNETVRTLELKLGWPAALTAHLQHELRRHFDLAWITGYQYLIPSMTNDPKDRHVAAAAVHAEVPLILTFNLRHFRPEQLAVWGVRAVHPQDFLIDLFTAQPSVVLTKLKQQASDRGAAWINFSKS